MTLALPYRIANVFLKPFGKEIREILGDDYGKQRIELERQIFKMRKENHAP